MTSASGARKCTTRSAARGTMSSLVSILRPSAIHWPKPKSRIFVSGMPTRFGPIRFWIRPSALRSITVTTPNNSAKTPIIGPMLRRMDTHGCTAPGNEPTTVCLVDTKIWSSEFIMNRSCNPSGAGRALRVDAARPVPSSHSVDSSCINESHRARAEYCQSAKTVSRSSHDNRRGQSYPHAAMLVAQTTSSALVLRATRLQELRVSADRQASRLSGLWQARRLPH